MATVEESYEVVAADETSSPWAGIGIGTGIVLLSIGLWEGGKWCIRKLRTPSQQAPIDPKTAESTKETEKN